jgi:hypothetical protein
MGSAKAGESKFHICGFMMWAPTEDDNLWQIAARRREKRLKRESTRQQARKLQRLGN